MRDPSISALNLQPAPTSGGPCSLASISDADLARIYGDLRRHAQHLLLDERRAHTLQATALVHEALCKLLGESSLAPELMSDADPRKRRRALFGAISLRMRQVLIDHARRRNAQKGPGLRTHTSLEEATMRVEQSGVDLPSLDRALEELHHAEPELAALFQLRWFGGLSMNHIAAVLEITPEEAQLRWTRARRLLRSMLKSSEATDD